MKKNSLAALFILMWIIGCNSGVKEKPNSSSELPRDIDKIKLTDKWSTYILKAI